MASPCAECGGAKEPGSRKRRCEPCLAKWYYQSGTRTLRREPCPRCLVGLKEQGRWHCGCAPRLVERPSIRYTDGRRDKYLQAQYGINLDDYADLFDSQLGGCAICGRPPQGRRVNLDVDHDHKTGALRGLLCERCNQQLLPIAKDNVDLLRAAADYLERAPLGWCPEPDDLPDSLRSYLRAKRSEDRPLNELPKWMRGRG